MEPEPEKYVYEYNKLINSLPDEKYDDVIKVIVDGVQKDDEPKSSIVEFMWFLKTIASKEGIKKFTTRINGELIPDVDLPSVNVEDIRILEISTFDKPR